MILKKQWAQVLFKNIPHENNDFRSIESAKNAVTGNLAYLKFFKLFDEKLINLTEDLGVKILDFSECGFYARYRAFFMDFLEGIVLLQKD